MDLVKKKGYCYGFDSSACQECGGACCTGESGYIWTKRDEIEKIAKFLELNLEDFAKMYLRKVGHRYSLIEREIGDNNYACVFFDEKLKRCMIYDVRPMQCRTFPFWEQYKGDEGEVRAECPGVV